MGSSARLLSEIKWATRQRLQYIEIMAYYTGVVSRSDIAKTFGISDAAATKDLKYYGEIAPNNLIYKHNVFGFVPSDTFEALFADLTPAVVLPMLAANLAVVGGPNPEHSVFGIHVDSLPLPTRLPNKAVLAQVLRAIKTRTKVSIDYRSLSDRESKTARIIEPHALINTGLRWHVRAYSEATYDFRDFVLSRIVEATRLEQEAESSAMYDDDWVEMINLQFSPHPGLSEDKRRSLLIDYAANNDVITLQTRRALVGYVLQRLAVDTTLEHSMNPSAYQLVLVNRDEVEPFAGWAFL